MRGGVDRGPCFSYWRLSYRRKFLRTCWTAPVLLLLLALLHAVGFFDWGIVSALPWPGGFGWWAFGVCALSGIVQGVYTFVRWRAACRPAPH